MDDYDFDNNYSSEYDDSDEYGPMPPPLLSRYDRYNNAFGSYRGGYGSGGGGDYGHPRFRPAFLAPGPPPLFGQGYGPRGPPRHLSKGDIDSMYRYLIRCGVPKDSLKNVPNDFYNMVTPEHCGLCGMDLIDFNLSRVHYSSKNHMKSQKKWLSKHSENPQRGKEAPLKARELYCELCDVQITSKAHADSHYSGKPHRAIVEGRKVPKNPVLLQRNMTARLEQLIRREKKAIKNADDKRPAVETPKVEDGKIDPELYCDICKTSVTCSEQMTAHLNGKKHLAKEKRHIFDMMKVNSADETYTDDDNGEQQQSGGIGDQTGGNGDQTGENGDQTGGNGDQAGGNGDQAGGNGDQTGPTDEPWTEAWNDGTAQ